MIGTVKWFNAEKGFGFIEREDGRMFCTTPQLKSMAINLDEGQRVQFDIEQAARTQAINVIPF